MNVLYVAARHIPEPRRLYVLDRLCRDSLEEAHDRTQRCLAWHRAIRELQEGGEIRVNQWSRDCDCCEGWYSFVVPVSELSAFIDRQLEGAEGPMSHSLARPSDQPATGFRDRVLEAFEDGHPWSV